MQTHWIRKTLTPIRQIDGTKERENNKQEGGNTTETQLRKVVYEKLDTILKRQHYATDILM